MHFVVRSAGETAVVIALVAPLIVAGMRHRGVRAWPPLLAVVALFAVDNLVLRVPRAPPFAALEWNWQGKLLEVFWVLAVVAVSRGLSLRDIGLTSPLRPRWRAPVLIVGAVTLAIPLAFLLLGARDTLTAEGWAFEATLPGLAEELVYRGVLLELCDRAMGRPWRIAGADVGWGLIVTTAMFAAGHAISISRTGDLTIEPLLAAGPLIGGLLAAWARARIGSLVPLIVLHNASNLVIPLATLWSSG